MIWVFFQHMYVIHLHRLKKNNILDLNSSSRGHHNKSFFLTCPTTGGSTFAPSGPSTSRRGLDFFDLTWPDLTCFIFLRRRLSSQSGEAGGGGEHYGRINKVDFREWWWKSGSLDATFWLCENPGGLRGTGSGLSPLDVSLKSASLCALVGWTI